MLAQRPVVSLSRSFAPGRIEQIEVLAIRYGDFDGREGYGITSEVFTLTSQGAIHLSVVWYGTAVGPRHDES
jgi:hypothetical protein